MRFEDVTHGSFISRLSLVFVPIFSSMHQPVLLSTNRTRYCTSILTIGSLVMSLLGRSMHKSPPSSPAFNAFISTSTGKVKVRRQGPTFRSLHKKLGKSVESAEGILWSFSP